MLKKILCLVLVFLLLNIPNVSAVTSTIDNFDVDRGTQTGSSLPWGSTLPFWEYFENDAGASQVSSTGALECFGSWEVSFDNDDDSQTGIRTFYNSSGGTINDLLEGIDEGDTFSYFIDTDSTLINASVVLDDQQIATASSIPIPLNTGTCDQQTWSFPVDFRSEWESLNLNDINRTEIRTIDGSAGDETISVDLFRYDYDVVADSAKEPFFDGPLSTCIVSNASCIVNSTGDSINGTTITTDINQFKISVIDTHSHIQDARAFVQSNPAIEDGSPTEQGTNCHTGSNNSCNYTFVIDLSTIDPGWILIDFNFSDHFFDYTDDESTATQESHRINSAGSSGTQDEENILWLFKASAGGGESSVITSVLNKIVVSGSVTDKAYLYTTNGSFTGQNFSNSEAGAGETGGICYDGTNFWMVDDSANKLFEYNSVGQPTGISIFVGPLDTLPTGLWCNSTHFVFAGDNTDKIYLLDSSGTLQNSFSVATEGGFPDGVTVRGNEYYVYHRSDNTVKIYDFEGNFTGESFDTSAQDSLGGGINWDGINFWLVGDETNTIYKYDDNWIFTGASFNVSTEDTGVEGITNTGLDPIIPLFPDGTTFDDNTVVAFGATYTDSLIWNEKTMGLSLDNITGSLIRQSFLPDGEILLFIENTKNLPSTFFLGFAGDGFDLFGPPIQTSPDTVIVQYFITKSPLNQCVFASLVDSRTGTVIPDRLLPEINIYHSNGTFIESVASSRATFCGLNDALGYDLTGFARGYAYEGETNVSVDDVVTIEMGGFSLTSRIFMTVFDNATDIGNLLEGAKIEFDTGGPFFTGPVGTTQFDLIRDRPTTVTVTLNGFETTHVTITPFEEFHAVNVAMIPGSGSVTDTFEPPDPESFVESVRLVIWLLFWTAAFATFLMLITFIFQLFTNFSGGRPRLP